MHRNGISGNARFGTNQKPLFANQLIDQCRFACVGAPNYGNLHWLIEGWPNFVTRAVEIFIGVDRDVNFGTFHFGACSNLIRQWRDQCIEVIQPLAMLRRELNWLAQTQGIGLE